MSDQTVRRYDTIAMDDLMEASQDAYDRGEPEHVDIPYLLAALNHYRQGYGRLYDELEATVDRITEPA